MTLFERNLLDIMRYIPVGRLGFDPTEADAIEVARLSGVERTDAFEVSVRKITEAIKAHRVKK